MHSTIALMAIHKNIFELTSRLRESVFEQPTRVPVAEKIQAVKHEMLRCLDELTGNDVRRARLKFRLTGTTDAETLWGLREELMFLLAGQSGESVARVKLERITAMFCGLVSPSRMPKSRF